MAIRGGDITEAYADAFGAWREAFEFSDTLKLFEKKSGQSSNIELLQIPDAWRPNDERIRGQVETLYKIEVIDQDTMTSDIMSRVNRLEWGSFYCTVQSIDPPLNEPRIWTFFTKEIKTGAIK